MQLYHYCSNDEFFSIVSKGVLWLSCLSLSNDSMEGKLVADLILENAKVDKMDDETIKHLKSAFLIVESLVDGLGFCLSENSDSLSQWRGYADDGSGVSIGFSNDYLYKLSELSNTPDMPGFTLQKVEYDRRVQFDLIKPTYLKIKEQIAKGAFKAFTRASILDLKSQDEIEEQKERNKKAFSDLHSQVISLVGAFFLLKTNAFSEESEWRLLSYLIKSNDQCLFRPSKDKLIPYRSYTLLDLKQDSIVEVVLGPKNQTPELIVDLFLKQNNFNNVKVVRSKASYR